jgi:hypothetical protein
VRIAVASAVLVATLTAHDARADDVDTGFYFAESLGVGVAHGDLASTVGHAIHTRAGAGIRIGWLAIEPWLMTDLQEHREGGLRGFLFGGQPVAGTADLDAYGLDLKVIAPLHRSRTALLEVYARGGAGLASGTGMLDGYTGSTTGGALGLQVTGRVRALGFLWAPLFFVQRGPFVTGALYIDSGYDLYRLDMPGAPTIRAHVGHVNVGFALGSRF